MLPDIGCVDFALIIVCGWVMTVGFSVAVIIVDGAPLLVVLVVSIVSTLYKYMFRGEGAKSHRGNMSHAQNSIMQMGKFLDNAPVGNPKQ